MATRGKKTLEDIPSQANDLILNNFPEIFLSWHFTKIVLLHCTSWPPEFKLEKNYE